MGPFGHQLGGVPNLPTFHQIADLGATRWPGRQRPRAALVPLSWPPPQVRHGQIGHHSAQNRRAELR